MKVVKIIANIILGDLSKIDIRLPLEKVSITNSLNEIQEDVNEGVTYVVAANYENVNAVINKKGNIYLPHNLFNLNCLNNETYGYFELEVLPFFRTFTEIFKKEVNPRGVFRYRRTIHEDSFLSTIVGDLYVITSLLGEPEDIHIKHSNLSLMPRHSIIMVNFGGGTMAHIEYTADDQEKIELEWSGIKHIIEFDSDQMKPVFPNDRTLLPLTYTVDAIVSTAKVIDEKVIARLDRFQKLMDGGGQL